MTLTYLPSDNYGKLIETCTFMHYSCTNIVFTKLFQLHEQLFLPANQEFPISDLNNSLGGLFFDFRMTALESTKLTGLEL